MTSVLGPEAVVSVANDVSHVHDLRAAARWLVGTSAAVVTVLVTGLQLRPLSGLDAVSIWVVIGALVAISVALLSAVWTLYRAVAVLAAPRRSIGELAELDQRDHGGYPDRRIESPSTGLVRYLVVTRRSDLLGASRDSIRELTQQYSKAEMALRTGRNTEIGGRPYRPGDTADSAALTSLQLDLELRIQRVVDAASAFETQESYKRLVKFLRWVGIPFVISILALGMLSTLPPRLMNVKEPTRVHVVMPSSMPSSCRGKTLEGVAVGGTMDAPIVVLPAQQGCPAQKLLDTDELIVLPKPAK